MPVRPAERKDVKELSRLTIQMHNHLGRLVGVEFSADDLGEEFFSGSESLAGVYVAVVTGKVVGYISFSKKIHKDEWCARHYRLDHLIVDEKHRRKGYGTELLRVLLQMAQKDDVNVVVDTFTKNEGTVEFFKSFGFKPFETIFLLDRKNRLKLDNRTPNPYH
jgi:ribosomal protein S18 acetylase RimI-like enzyme